MAPRKSDARRSDASVAVAAPPPQLASPAAAPVQTGPDDDSATPQTPGNGQAQTQADKRDKDHKDKDAATIEDLTLPKSIITRLAKGVLPPNTQIQANAILAMSKGATVFISYLASHTNEHTANANKKTISPADVFKALDDTEFAFLRAPLEAEFAKYNAIQTEKRSSYRQKVRAARDGQSKTDEADATDTTKASEPAAGPRTKRPRVEPRDKAETEDDGHDGDADDDVDDDDDQADDEVTAAAATAEMDDEDDGDGDDDDAPGSGDETQDALESRAGEGDEEEPDEALDVDESD